MTEPVDYRTAGVDLQAADSAKRRIIELAQSTYTPGVLAGAGPFSGLFRLDVSQLRDPVLVSSCDGVGTKLKLAIRAGFHKTIGMDIVNHCVNDIMTCGARPLFFLDYIALARMDPSIVSDIVHGIARACRDNSTALIGGETAEMPGVYRIGDYDVAGFITGIVERDAIVDGSEIRPGQVVLGLAGNGPHTNGYSLIRKILFDLNNFELDERPDALNGASIGEAVMAVHPSYKAAIEALRGVCRVYGMAHITGGGLPGNLVRILPEGMQAVVDTGRWTVPLVFPFLQGAGQVSVEDMFEAFNMGIGFVIIVDGEEVPRAIDTLGTAGLESWAIGNITNGPRTVRLNLS